MRPIEVESFMTKFVHLWKTGQDANLNIHSHAGNAWVQISLNIGRYPGSNICTDAPIRKNASPSRVRRREKRAAARRASSTYLNPAKDETILIDTGEANSIEVDANTGNVNTEDNTDFSISAEEAIGEIDTIEQPAAVEASSADVISNKSSADSIFEDLHDGNTVDGKSPVQHETDEQDVTLEKDETGSNDAIVDTSDTKSRQIGNGSLDSTSNQKDKDTIDSGKSNIQEVQTHSDVVLIYGAATVDNSPFNSFAQEELDSVVRFITDKDHMKKNISHIEWKHISTRINEDSSFQHIIGVTLTVKTSNLWETPRSYIYRHIGQDSWHRGNGSKITIRRIHQK